MHGLLRKTIGGRIKSQMNFADLLKSVKYRGFVYTFALGVDVLTRPVVFRLFSKHAFDKFDTFLRLGYVANTDDPRTFNEHIQHRKNRHMDPRACVIADKYAVRAYVSGLGLGRILNELYDVTDDPETISFQDLTRPYALKTNHGSGMVRIVSQNDAAQPDELRALCRKWLKTSYNESSYGTEYQYDSIPPKIIIEKFLRNENGSPLLDYKFYCFGGRVEFISVVDNTEGIPLVSVYDREWAALPFGLYNTATRILHAMPAVLDEMISCAEKLSGGWDFLRVDLYLINATRIVFGELTYSPGGGMLRFQPRTHDFIYGQKLAEVMKVMAPA